MANLWRKSRLSLRAKAPQRGLARLFSPASEQNDPLRPATGRVTNCMTISNEDRFRHQCACLRRGHQWSSYARPCIGSDSAITTRSYRAARSDARRAVSCPHPKGKTPAESRADGGIELARRVSDSRHIRYRDGQCYGSGVRSRPHDLGFGYSGGFGRRWVSLASDARSPRWVHVAWGHRHQPICSSAPPTSGVLAFDV